jgi:hypothetical protein
VSRSRHIAHASFVHEWRQAQRVCVALAKIEKKKSKRNQKEKIEDRDRSGGGCFEARTFQSLA